MRKRALRTLWWLIVSADIIGITLIISPQLVPISAAALTAFAIHALLAKLEPEPVYDWPQWAYRIAVAASTRLRSIQAQNAARASARAAAVAAPHPASGTAGHPARPPAPAPHPN